MVCNILFAGVIFVVGVYSANVTTGPDVEVSSGSDASLLCNVTGLTSSSTLTWFKGPDIQTSDTVYVVQYGDHYPQPGYDRHTVINPGTLVINATVGGDNGIYWCDLAIPGAFYGSDSVKLTVVVAPKYAVITIPTEVTEFASMVQMVCNADTLSELDYGWFNDSQQIDTSDDNLILTDNTLTIVTVTRYDMAFYNCCAINIAGYACSNEEFLNVLYLPDYPWPECETSQPPEGDDYFQAGHAICITCQATDGNPEPVLTWYNGSKPMELCLLESSGDPIQTTSTCEWILDSTDNGRTYTCQGTHDTTPDIPECDTGQLYVQFPPVEPDDCQTDLSGYSGPILAGEELNMMCTSCSSNPPSNITWYVDDNIVHDGVSDLQCSSAEYHGFRTTSYLSWELTHRDHGKVITCAAHNYVFPKFTNPSNETRLNVHYAPMANDAYAISVADEMETGNLTCQVNSNPDVNITWYDSLQQQIVATERVYFIDWRQETIQTSILVIQNVSDSDYGNYTCYSVNSVGSCKFVVTLIEEAAEGLLDESGSSSGAIIITSLLLVIIICVCIAAVLYFLKRRQWNDKNRDTDMSQRNFTSNEYTDNTTLSNIGVRGNDDGRTSVQYADIDHTHQPVDNVTSVAPSGDVYATVNKERQQGPSRLSEAINPAALYTVVDRSKMKKKPEVSTPSIELQYAVVNRNKQPENEIATSVPVYAVAKKNKNASPKSELTRSDADSEKCIPPFLPVKLPDAEYEDVAISNKKPKKAKKPQTIRNDDSVPGKPKVDGHGGTMLKEYPTELHEKFTDNNAKDKNVEGLVYADLDLLRKLKPHVDQNTKPSTTAREDPEKIEYAAIDFTNRNT